MANIDKNIRITTSKNKTTLPNIVFTGSAAGTSVLTLEVRDDNSIAFTGLDGDVFSLDYDLSSGTIWSVNDKTGVPFLRSSFNGLIGLAEFGGTVGIGQTNPQYKFDVKGNVGFASTNDNSYSVLIDNVSAAGSNSLQLRAQNDLRFFNTANSFYTGFQAGNPAANTTYTWPTAFPGSGTSVLASDTSGTMSWVAAGAGGGSGVTSLTAGAGISFSTGTTITTTGTVRAKRFHRLTFMSGFTPVSVGVDSVTLKVPDNFETAASDRIYNCREVELRVEATSLGTSTITIQKYGYAAGAGTSLFSTTSTGSTTNIMAAALSISGTPTYEAGTTSFAAGHGTVGSGDKLRVNFTALSSSHLSFTISLIIEEQ